MKNQIMEYENELGVVISATIKENEPYLTVKQISDLYGIHRSVTYRHINNILKSGELTEESIVASDAKNEKHGRKPKGYNLDWVLNIGFRVESSEGVKFRKEVSNFIKKYYKDGYVLNETVLLNDEEKLEGLEDSFKKLRAETTSFQKQINGVLKEGASDYYSNETLRNRFFMEVSDKLNYAITNMTAKDIRYNRTHSSLPECGTTTQTGKKGVTKTDLKNARNFLTPEEHKQFGYLCDSILVVIRSSVRRSKRTMTELLDRIDSLIDIVDYDIKPQGYKSVSKNILESHQNEQYDRFKINMIQ